MRHVGSEERRTALADRHRLLPSGRTDDVVQIADSLVALHSSDPATVFLSVLARMRTPTTNATEMVLYQTRDLLRHHAMRRTLWVASREMTVAMHAASTRKIAAGQRTQLLKYLGQTTGIDDPVATLEQLEAEIMELLAEGPLTTREIGLRHPELTRKITVGSGNHTIDVGAHTRVTNLAGFEARLLRGRPRGTWVASEYTWHPIDDWAPINFDEADERTGAAVVLAAWLRRFGPGTETDLCWWTGWTKTMTRRALSDVEAVEVSLDRDQTGWMMPDDPILDGASAETPEPWIAVLPGLDPTTMGWKERSWYLADDVRARVFDRNGNAGPTVWCNGQIVGGWAQRPNGELAVELVQDLPPDMNTLLEVELDRIRVAIGDMRFRVRFPSPNQKDLLA